jgi:enoyl-CoA hydratase/carnithine racemase
VDNPPVNAFSLAVTDALVKAFRDCSAADAVRAVSRLSAPRVGGRGLRVLAGTTSWRQRWNMGRKTAVDRDSLARYECGFIGG